ncbi:MAG: helix-turn-helix domain-containing protein [Elusimicrobia bacterium]|nr:helix-turn-helix domain-containing protein [Elusimicrobiota bacterium]
MKRLGDLLSALRRRRGISQLQLADEAGVNSSVVSRAERGGDALSSTWEKLFLGLGHRLSFDTEELAEECADILAEEAARRRERRREGLLKARRHATLRW